MPHVPADDVDRQGRRGDSFYATQKRSVNVSRVIRSAAHCAVHFNEQTNEQTYLLSDVVELLEAPAVPPVDRGRKDRVAR